MLAFFRALAALGAGATRRAVIAVEIYRGAEPFSKASNCALGRTTMTTCYDVLGVPRNASDEMITTAFCRFVNLRPALSTGDLTAEQQFRQVAAAYEILKDPQQRSEERRVGKEGRARKERCQ